MTIREAAEQWVRRDMIPIPEPVVEKLFAVSEGADILEITPPAIYDKVVYPYGGEIAGTRYHADADTEYLVEGCDGERKWLTVNELETEHDDVFPIWGTMWAFADSLDNEWVGDAENLQKMANCGFRIYESEDYGYIFGIDGAGYDFYESHWIPLYKVRGLQWHDKEV